MNQIFFIFFREWGGLSVEENGGGVGAARWRRWLSAPPGPPSRLNDAPRRRIRIPSPLAFNFSLILHTAAAATWVTRAAAAGGQAGRQAAENTSECNLPSARLLQLGAPVAAAIILP